MNIEQNIVWDLPPHLLKAKIQGYLDNGVPSTDNTIKSMQWQVDNPEMWQRVQDSIPTSSYRSEVVCATQLNQENIYEQ